MAASQLIHKVLFPIPVLFLNPPELTSITVNASVFSITMDAPLFNFIFALIIF